MRVPLLARSIIMLGCLAAAATAAADPIRLAPAAITASSSYAGFPPGNVNDGNTNSYWTAGGYAPAWIQLDYGQPIALSELHLYVNQTPSGATVHQIAVGPDLQHLTTAFTINQDTATGEAFVFHAKDAIGGPTQLGNVRFVRVTTQSSPSWVGWSEIYATGSIEYFGYWGDTFWQGGGPLNGDYMSETHAAGANVTWIAEQSTTALVQKLQEAQQLGVKVVVVLDWLMWNGGSTCAAGDLSSPSGNWLTIAAAVAPYIDNVAAFYLHDEPYGSQDSSTPAGLQQIVDIRNELWSAADQIRDSFPGVPIAGITDAGYLSQFATAADFAMFDWVGYDCYDISANCDPLRPKLKALLNATQRMIAVPAAWQYGSDTSQSFQSNTIIADIDNSWDLELRRDPRYVVVAPFLWSPLPTACGYTNIGARDLTWDGTPSGPRVVANWVQQMVSPWLQSGTERVYPTGCTASGSMSGAVCFNAFDNSKATSWNGGSWPDQSITASFPGLVHVASITAIPNQQPDGVTTQSVWGQKADGSWVQLATSTQHSYDSQPIVWLVNADVTAIKIETTSGPAWVAWREIAFHS